MFIYLHVIKKITDMQDQLQMDEAAYTLKAISHGTRLCVISLLADTEEMNVSEIEIGRASCRETV